MEKIANGERMDGWKVLMLSLQSVGVSHQSGEVRLAMNQPGECTLNFSTGKGFDWLECRIPGITTELLTPMTQIPVPRESQSIAFHNYNIQCRTRKGENQFAHRILLQ
jgi:hypothetical protein